ncbi:MAG: hypothetical protein ACOX1Y_11780 [Zhaonellaceae bacterium]|jgi:ABC-type transport system involved in cytochrome c biogenesis permease component|nr:hypothetical protein [Clostridia bacterium]
MKNLIDLILKIAVVICFVLTNLINDVVIKGIIILSLAFLTTILTVFKFKIAPEMILQEKISDILVLIAIVFASVFIIYRLINF